MYWPTITKDTPIEEIHRIHKAIWQYVVENGEKPNTPYWDDCILCEYRYLLDFMNTDEDCILCPVVWENGKCYEKGSPYRRWMLMRNTGFDDFANPFILKRLAEKIRDIPFKYELEVKEND